MKTQKNAEIEISAIYALKELNNPACNKPTKHK